MKYRLIGDDGKELRVHGGIWESVLELAYLYGWKPAGTEEPQTEAWRLTRRRGPESTWEPRVWNCCDYFSRESQHVGHEDARTLAKAVFRGLSDIPDRASSTAKPPSTHRTLYRHSNSGASTFPSVVDELSGRRKSAARRVALFATRGGFTIDRVLRPH